MRRAALVACLMTIAALAGASIAGASIPLEYGNLAHKRLKPAALVPITAPKALSPLSATLGGISSPAGPKSYRIRLTGRGTGAAKAIIVLDRGTVKSVAAALKVARSSGYTIRSARVRGQNAKLFTDRPTRPRFFSLVWSEKGAVYQLGTGTTGSVSLKDLLSFAKGLQPLEREYVAAVCSQGYCQGAIVVTTPKTASVLFEWEARCDDPDGIGQALLGNAGSARFSLLPRNGDSFAFHIAPADDQPWTVDGAGEITPGAVTLNLRASGSPKGRPCDTGQLTLNADKPFAD